MTKLSKFSPRLKRVSGYAIAKNTKKIVGCENCNYMVLGAVAPVNEVPVTKTNSEYNQKSTEHNRIPGSRHKTGDECPRCALPLLRLYDSQAEFGRAQELKLLRSSGDIDCLEFQVPFPLYTMDTQGKKVKVATYIADFTYLDMTKPTHTEGVYVVEDVKPKGGLVTDVFILKKKWFEAQNGYEIKIVER